MEAWYFIHKKLSEGIDVQLLYVVDNERSSPGRRGFKMAVSADGEYIGTIGGGIMEHKLTEKAKARLHEAGSSVILMRQYHDKEHSKEQSGMICEGSQVVVFIPLTAKHEALIRNIIDAPQSFIRLSPAGLSLLEIAETKFVYESETSWEYTEQVNVRPVIHIIGGGHVSLALSELMCYLGFYSKVYDDRPSLHTILQNFFANEKIIVPDYEKIADYADSNRTHFCVIMTMGYRTDKIALRHLVNKEFFYLGMMGSEAKVETILRELKEEGIAEEALQKVFMPIGVNIFSKTAQEIAVSIAAEIIREKNKHLPTGRQGSVE